MVADPSDRSVVDMHARRVRMLGPIQIVRKASKATGTARAALNVIASYADADTLLARPGRATLERETGFSRATLRRAIRRLECPHYDPNKRPDGCGVTPCPDREIEVVRVGHGSAASVYRITLSAPGDNPVDNRPNPNGNRGHTDPGEGSQGPRGRGHSDPLPKGTEIDRGEGAREFPDHCPTHRLVEDPPPCRRCGQTREANAAARLEADRVAKAEADRRRREETARRQASGPRPSSGTPDWFHDARRTRRPDPS